MDALAGVTQEEGHTGFLCFASAVLVLSFYREKDSAVPSLVDHGKSFFLYPRSNRSPLVGHDVRKIPVRVTAPRFELTSKRQKVSRLPTEPPGRYKKANQSPNRPLQAINSTVIFPEKILREPRFTRAKCAAAATAAAAAFVSCCCRACCVLAIATSPERAHDTHTPHTHNNERFEKSCQRDTAAVL